MTQSAPAPRKVLILCTANSCRSQMAEALVNHRLAGKWQASSAGVQPAREIHPLALEVLAEAGIHHSGTPKSLQEFFGQDFDMVITVCDDAAENCPAWFGKGKRVHIGFPDPALATGSHAERMEVFRQVRDDIQARLIPYLAQVSG